MELCKIRVLFCIVLVFLGLVLSAGCVHDSVPPSRPDTDGEDPDAKYFEEEEENETGYEESYNTMGGGGFLDKAEGYYDEESAREAYGSSGYVVDDYPDETGVMDEEDDYVIDDSVGTPLGNPVDAVKNPEDYAVQDNGTVSVNTDSGDVDGS